MKQADMKQSSKVSTRSILFLVVVLLAGILALRGTPAAHAAGGIIVNTDADTVADDGVCTLREAITAANSDSASGATAGECAAGSGADTITFDADYTITLVVLQLPAVTSELTITGNGAANSIIQANAAPDTALSRVFKVTAIGNLTLDSVNVRHGRCARRPVGGDCGLIFGGGGIYNAGGTMTVTNSALSGNSGGGTYNEGGTLTVTNSTLSDNTSSGIYNAGGMVTVTDSTLSGNTSNLYGGGISNDGGTLTVTNSTISGSTDGGGICNISGTLIVINSTISGNTGSNTAGGITNLWYGTLVTVTNSTIAGNSGSQGGGIYNAGSLTVADSTITGNYASSGITSGGAGGISNDSRDALGSYFVGTVTLTRSLVSGNSSYRDDYYTGVDEVYNRNNIGATGTITADEFNVFGHSGESNADAFTNFTPGAGDFNATTDGTPTALTDILDTTLADNSGPTETHALVAASPAIDFTGVCGLPTDQRGVIRQQGAACDAGAFELEVSNTAPTANPGGPYLGAINTDIQLDSSASSDPEADSLSYTWDFGDGSSGTGVMPSHSYAGAGIYNVCLTVNDGTVNSDPNCTIVVVYDPSGGFVTGGGWIDSPAGAYSADPDLTGRATFGFVAKYKKGASVPTGNTSFALDLAGLAFYSDSYEWLVVNRGGANAQFKGSGTVNGGLDPNGEPYKFMLWAGDGSPDTFRIKIWFEDGGVETVVYDNGFDGSGNEAGQPIGAGNIVVHKGK